MAIRNIFEGLLYGTAVCNAGCNLCAFLAGHPQPPQKGKLMNKIWSDFCWGGYLLERGGGWSCAFRPMLTWGVLTDFTRFFQNWLKIDIDFSKLICKIDLSRWKGHTLLALVSAYWCLTEPQTQPVRSRALAWWVSHSWLAVWSAEGWTVRHGMTAQLHCAFIRLLTSLDRPVVSQ